MVLGDGLLTSAEIARVLRVHPKHVYRLVKRGLPGHRFGSGHWRFRREEVLAWMEARPTRGVEVGEAVEVSVAPHAGSISPRRLLLGRVGQQWVAHGMAATDRRSADALVEAYDAGRARVQGPDRASASNILVAGCAPVLGPVLDRVERTRDAGRCHWIATNSSLALDLLARGYVHVAGLHLENAGDGAGHATLVRQRLPGRRVHLVNLVRWRTGLALRDDGSRRGRAPKLTDLTGPDTRWALREPGSGARQVLEHALAAAGTDASALTTALVAPDHRTAALAVALGAAEVGVVIESVALELGLRFFPLAEEAFDLALATDAPEPADLLRSLDALDDPRLRREVSATGPYDTNNMGHAAEV